MWTLARLGSDRGVAAFDVIQACTPPISCSPPSCATEGPAPGSCSTITISARSCSRPGTSAGEPMHWGLGRLERLGMALSDVVIGDERDVPTPRHLSWGKRPEDVFVVRNGSRPSVFRPVPPDPGYERWLPT